MPRRYRLLDESRTSSSTKDLPRILFLPTMYCPIDEQMEIKMKALGSHRSQLSRTHIAEFAAATAIRRGSESWMGKYAEGFVPFRLSLFLGGDLEKGL